MTGTPTSTDPATLRGMAESMETAAVRMPPEQLNVIAILLGQAAINRAIAAEKEAQAAPPAPDGYLTSWHKRQVGAQWHYTEKPRADWREVGLDVKPFWFRPPRADDANAPRLICTGCGSVETIEEIRARHPAALSCCPERKMVDRFDVIRAYEAAKTPRVYRTGERLGGGLVAVPEKMTTLMRIAFFETASDKGAEIEHYQIVAAWDAMLAAIVSKSEDPADG